MKTIIKRVESSEIATLRKISMITFSATFKAENTDDNLREYLDSAYAEDKLKGELENPNSYFYFIYADDQLAGYLKLNSGAAQTEEMTGPALEIERIYVLSEFKRRGLGKALYHKALEVATANHKSYLWLGVWEHNAPALNFYRKLGFKMIGDHVFVLGNDKQRDLIMRKPIKVD